VIWEAGSVIDGTFLARHLNLFSYDRDEPAFLKDGARKLRTLFSRFFSKSWEFRGLRSLTLNVAYMTELPDSICRPKHLRYLDVSQTNIKAFPKSITKLCHLQTLRFRRCWFLEKLPNKMEYLVSLRHIDFSHTPADVGFLTGLRTLPFFEVGQDKGHKIEELGCLKELGGELRIVNLEHVRDKKEAKGASLFGKAKINTLVLVWSSERKSSLLEGLQPHPDIRSLEIENYQGDEFPPWLLMPILNNLAVLKLKGCKKLPTAGNLPHLEILEIEGMDGVKKIGEEFYSSGGSGTGPIFPALKRLSLVNMWSLVEWMIPATVAGGVQVALPCLEELYMSWSPELRSCDALSHIPGEFHASATSLKYLTILGCSRLTSIPSLQNCTALEVLSIYKCYNVVSTIILELHSLKSVFIDRCGKATVRVSWPLSRANVKDLKVKDCREPIFFYDDDDLHRGELWPSRLQSLVIGFCNYFNSVPNGLNRRLHSLIQLEISFCQNLSHIPEDFFCGLNQLKVLKIGSFSEELEAFPGMNSIHHLGGSLKKLKIFGWKNLKSEESTTSTSTPHLPCEIKDLSF